MASLKTYKGSYKFKQKNIVLGTKKINKEISKNNLLEVKRIFDKENLFFGLIYGTLLGAIRENDFLDHDEDIDLYVLGEDEEKLKLMFFELKKSGFELIRYERRGLYSIERNGEYIDFYIMKPFAKGVLYGGGDGFMLERHLLNTKLIDFQGAKFAVPSQSIEWLELYYGETWKTPIIYNYGTTPGYKIVISKMRSIIRRSLPSFVYNMLNKYFHSKHYNLFCKRCLEMNITP